MFRLGLENGGANKAADSRDSVKLPVIGEVCSCAWVDRGGADEGCTGKILDLGTFGDVNEARMRCCSSLGEAEEGWCLP